MHHAPCPQGQALERALHIGYFHSCWDSEHTTKSSLLSSQPFLCAQDPMRAGPRPNARPTVGSLSRLLNASQRLTVGSLSHLLNASQRLMI